jgi:hypothetical protein
VIRSCVASVCLTLAAAPATADEPDGSAAKERLRELLREIIERQQQIRQAVVESHPP